MGSQEECESVAAQGGRSCGSGSGGESDGVSDMPGVVSLERRAAGERHSPAVSAEWVLSETVSWV